MGKVVLQVIKYTVNEVNQYYANCLLNERVFSIEFFEDGHICIFEGCDGYFYHELSKEECMELSNIFKELAEEIKVSE